MIVLNVNNMLVKVSRRHVGYPVLFRTFVHELMCGTSTCMRMKINEEGRRR